MSCLWPHLWSWQPAICRYCPPVQGWLGVSSVVRTAPGSPEHIRMSPLLPDRLWLSGFLPLSCLPLGRPSSLHYFSCRQMRRASCLLPLVSGVNQPFLYIKGCGSWWEFGAFGGRFGPLGPFPWFLPWRGCFLKLLCQCIVPGSSFFHPSSCWPWLFTCCFRRSCLSSRPQATWASAGHTHLMAWRSCSPCGVWLFLPPTAAQRAMQSVFLHLPLHSNHSCLTLSHRKHPRRAWTVASLLLPVGGKAQGCMLRWQVV